MPKLWDATVEAHRRAVRDAILDTAAQLAFRNGLTSVTMSQIAEETGIGRATLYKYFSDVEAILVAWHERQVAKHLRQLEDIRDKTADPRAALQSVLEAYAHITHEHHGPPANAFLHRREHVARAQQRLTRLIRDLLVAGGETGEIRTDVPPEELTAYCLHAVAAAGSVASKTATARLVQLVMAGLRPSQ